MAKLTRMTVRLGALGALATWLGGCADGVDRIAGPADAPPLIVSDPVREIPPVRSSAAAVMTLTPVGATATAAAAVAYVSLPPGTVPTGVAAVIRNAAAGSAVRVPVVAGGFDPVPVAARAGDALELVVSDAAGAAVYTAAITVPVRRPPKVVRTVPPKGKTDVPLNARITVVFSEPIDASTLTGTSVQLRQGASAIAGRLEFRDPDHLTAAFVPAAPLAAGTPYTLVVTQGIHDLDGEALEAAVSVEFTTTSRAASGPVSVTVTPDAVTMVPGSVMIRAIVRDASGNEISGPVSWQSSDATVAVVLYADYGEQLVEVAGRAVGSATITASASGRSGSATVSVGYASFGDASVGPNRNSCFLTPAGAAYCRGQNQWGQLGYGLGASVPGGPSGAATVAVVGGLAFTAISTGHSHTCALTTGGTAYCWGANYAGQLGTANTLGPCNPEDLSTASCSHTPVAVSGGLTFAQISAGWEHTCGLTPGGAAYCWGSNSDGQLGNGTFTSSRTPVAVTGGLTFTQISAGSGHTCGLTPGGIAYCWGGNESGQLGDGTTDNRRTPVAVRGGLAFIQIAAGGSHTCGLATGGKAFCWGNNYLGALGDGTKTDSPTPVAVADGRAFSRIAAAMGVTCGLATGGDAYCWGWTGELDAGDDWIVVPEPTRIPGGLSFESLDSDGAESCGRATDGLVYCWYGLGNPYRVRGQG